jgi:Transcription factor IIIC subunit delta N-term
MSADVALRLWPNVPNALSWSADGDIALAASDNVELLVSSRIFSFPDESPSKALSLLSLTKEPQTPKVKSTTSSEHEGTDTMGANRLWETLHLQTNSFTDDELWVQDPLSFPSWSAGEEISTADVAALVWSPPGLAKYRRCALAVLTTNLALSIWASESSPKQLSSWSRVMMVNHALDEYFDKEQPENDVNVEMNEVERITFLQSKLEREKKQMRIRAFAWSDPLHVPGAASHWGEQFLAVSNDCNEVLLLRILSPYSKSSTKQGKWTASVATRIQLRSGEETGPTISSTAEDCIPRPTHVRHLAWSPWFKNSDGTRSSILTSATNTNLEFTLIKARSVDALTFKPLRSEKINPFVVDITGPIRWYPKITGPAPGDMVCVTATNAEVKVNCFMASQNPKMSHFAYPRSEWDAVSAFAFSSPQPREIVLHMSNHLSTLDMEQPTMLLDGERAYIPKWRKRISERKENYNQELELAGNIKTKVWGMDSSPIGDMLATAVSYHPSDMPEYQIAADRECFIDLHPLLKGADTKFVLPKLGGLRSPKGRFCCPVSTALYLLTIGRY